MPKIKKYGTCTLKTIFPFFKKVCSKNIPKINAKLVKISKKEHKHVS